MSRHWQDPVWRVLSEYTSQHMRARRCTPRQAPRHMVQIVAHLGSPASSTALVLNLSPQDVQAFARGRFTPTILEQERLHSWLICCIWRHLWRAGSPEHSAPDAIEEALQHAACLADVPRLWWRDWRLAREGVEL